MLLSSNSLRLCFPCTCEWLEVIITGGGAIRQMMHRLSTSGADVDKVIVVNSGLSSMAMGIGVGAGVS